MYPPPFDTQIGRPNGYYDPGRYHTYQRVVLYVIPLTLVWKGKDRRVGVNITVVVSQRSFRFRSMTGHFSFPESFVVRSGNILTVLVPTDILFIYIMNTAVHTQTVLLHFGTQWYYVLGAWTLFFFYEFECCPIFASV